MISMNCVRVKIILLSCLLILPLCTPVPSAAQGKTYCRADVEEKVVALTFDDGPHYKYTEEILDILKKHDVRATFFTVGENALKFPDLIDRELKEGHEVANHTYSHRHMAKLKEDELVFEILEWENAVYCHNEYTSQLFRPPEGVLTKDEQEIVDRLGYDVILWSIDTRDWEHTSSERIVTSVTKNVTGGSIILFHDFVSGKSPTPAALESLIPKLKEMGYDFVTVSRLQDLERANRLR